MNEQELFDCIVDNIQAEATAEGAAIHIMTAVEEYIRYLNNPKVEPLQEENSHVELILSGCRTTSQIFSKLIDILDGLHPDLDEVDYNFAVNLTLSIDCYVTYEIKNPLKQNSIPKGESCYMCGRSLDHEYCKSYNQVVHALDLAELSDSPECMVETKLNLAPTCEHDLKKYLGLNESYKFCTKCPHKE